MHVSNCHKNDCARCLVLIFLISPTVLVASSGGWKVYCNKLAKYLHKFSLPHSEEVFTPNCWLTGNKYILNTYTKMPNILISIQFNGIFFVFLFLFYILASYLPSPSCHEYEFVYINAKGEVCSRSSKFTFCAPKPLEDLVTLEESQGEDGSTDMLLVMPRAELLQVSRTQK